MLNWALIVPSEMVVCNELHGASIVTCYSMDLISYCHISARAEISFRVIASKRPTPKKLVPLLNPPP